MATENKNIHLTIGAIYAFEMKNFILQSYTNEKVKFKFLEDNIVKFKEFDMQYFLNSQPLNMGKI